jgi:hypothetical protein
MAKSRWSVISFDGNIKNFCETESVARNVASQSNFPYSLPHGVVSPKGILQAVYWDGAVFERKEKAVGE